MTYEQLGWVLIVLAVVGGPLALAFFVHTAVRDKRERFGHDDRDSECIFWWGDCGGSLYARCPICRGGK